MRAVPIKSSSDRPTAAGKRQFLAWQGWTLSVPTDWNAVKLDGTYQQGSAVLADLADARLGLRWATVGRSKRSPDEVVKEAMRREVGELTPDHDSPSAVPADANGFIATQLYEEPAPPGRDVWIGLCASSNRLLQIVYHTPRRDRVLRRTVLAELEAQEAEAPQSWSVLDLSCESPAGFSLASHALSAGDLRMTFEAPGSGRIMVRQIGPATLALSRQPLRDWVQQHLSASSKLYRGSEPVETALVTESASWSGVRVEQSRRRRAFLHRSLPATMVTLALNDEVRNRIVMVQANDVATAERVARTVGWASRLRGQVWC